MLLKLRKCFATLFKFTPVLQVLENDVESDMMDEGMVLFIWICTKYPL